MLYNTNISLIRGGKPWDVSKKTMLLSIVSNKTMTLYSSSRSHEVLLKKKIYHLKQSNRRSNNNNNGTYSKPQKQN